MRRRLLEALRLLSARAPRLDRTLKKITRTGGIVVLLDGTPVRTRRPTGDENRPNYRGKHKAHGLLFLALTDERGNLLRTPAARPDRSSEITTAHLRNAGLDDNPDNPAIVTGRRATRDRHATVPLRALLALTNTEAQH